MNAEALRHIWATFGKYFYRNNGAANLFSAVHDQLPASLDDEAGAFGGDPDVAFAAVLVDGEFGRVGDDVGGIDHAGDERARLWQRWSAVDRGLDGYAARRSTETPVVVLEPRDGTP